MKAKITNSLFPRKNFHRILLGTTALLLIPLVAMQFSEDVRWGLADFIIIGGLLIGAGLAYEAIASMVNSKYRTIAAIVVVLAVLLIWVELAVGIFGTPVAGS